MTLEEAKRILKQVYLGDDLQELKRLDRMKHRAEGFIEGHAAGAADMREQVLEFIGTHMGDKDHFICAAIRALPLSAKEGL